MNFKELVEVIAPETERPAAHVRKVSLAVLVNFAGLIESQTNFVSPVITLTAGTTPAKPATEVKPAKLERKFARMIVRPKRPAAPAAD